MCKIKNMIFTGSRKFYTLEKVKELRNKRRQMKAKRKGVDPIVLSYALGDLKAAGHLRVVGYENIQTNTHESKLDDGRVLIHKKNVLKFDSSHMNDVNEAPHLKGYLQSASEADKHQYQIRGWFNPDGTVRLELTSPFIKK
jgi:hypothetical protein